MKERIQSKEQCFRNELLITEMRNMLQECLDIFRLDSDMEEDFSEEIKRIEKLLTK